jgi:hypothetical protein
MNYEPWCAQTMGNKAILSALHELLLEMLQVSFQVKEKELRNEVLTVRVNLCV